MIFSLLFLICQFNLVISSTVYADGEKNEIVLYDFEKNFSTDKVTEKFAILKIFKNGENSALKIQVMANSDWAWPGVNLSFPENRSDFSKFTCFQVDVKNCTNRQISVIWQVNNTGKEKNKKWLIEDISLGPFESKTVILFPQHYVKLSDGTPKLFGMRGIPQWAYSENGEKHTLDMAQVTEMLFYMRSPTKDTVFEIDNIKVDNCQDQLLAEPIPDHPLPFVDTFGQYKHKNWPGKLHSTQDLQNKRDKEDKDLAGNPPPQDWNSYGGWGKSHKFEKTGWFYPIKFKNKWWLIDPNGNLFFANGIHGVRPGTATPVEGRDTWFDEKLWKNQSLKKYFSKIYIKDTPSAIKQYAGRNIGQFNFHKANLLRKYGKDWEKQFASITEKRLKSWGINTIGGHSDTTTSIESGMPYLSNIYPLGAQLLASSNGHWEKFYDVFSSSFKEKLEANAVKQIGKAIGDPNCIGFFTDNELGWGYNGITIALDTLKCPASQPAKIEFINNLKEKYKEIAGLNRAWNEEYMSWEDLLNNTKMPDEKAAKDDLVAFYIKTAETYFQTSQSVIRKYAPNQLYIGCRFSNYNPVVVQIAAKYCDIISFNLYKEDVRHFSLPEGVDAPVIIGEFHFGALDRGLFAAGIVRAENQEDRANKYARYVRSALGNPTIVGCNWFMLYDQPLTGTSYGRGENFQIGFLDICDSPYPEIIKASRGIGSMMYRLRNDTGDLPNTEGVECK